MTSNNSGKRSHCLKVTINFTPDAICSVLNKLFGLPNVRLTNPTLISQALQWHERGLDFSDAMLEAAATLAREFRLPCQVSLEEFMACAVGGCAGCVVQVRTQEGLAMQRVCVDGPVFDAYAVFG